MKLKLSLGVFLFYLLILNIQSSLIYFDNLHGFRCFGTTKISVAIRLNTNNKIECFSVNGKTCDSNLNTDSTCKDYVNKNINSYQPIQCKNSELNKQGHWCKKAYNYFFDKWHCQNETGIRTGIKIDHRSGNPMCISLNGKDCLWGKFGKTLCNRLIYSKATNAKIKPLICGQQHRIINGNSGYNISNDHWCKKAFAFFKYDGKWYHKAQTGFNILIGLDKNGNIGCARVKGKNKCLRVSNKYRAKKLLEKLISLNNLKLLKCGNDLKKRTGYSGFESTNHWCNKSIVGIYGGQYNKMHNNGKYKPISINNYSNKKSNRANLWNENNRHYFNYNNQNFKNNYRKRFQSYNVNNNSIPNFKKRKSKRVDSKNKNWKNFMIRKYGPDYTSILRRKLGPNWRNISIKNRKFTKKNRNIKWHNVRSSNYKQRKFGRNYKENWQRKLEPQWRKRMSIFDEEGNNIKNINNSREEFINTSQSPDFQKDGFGSNIFVTIMIMKYGYHWKNVMQKKYGRHRWVNVLRKKMKKMNMRKYLWNNKGRLIKNLNWSTYHKIPYGSKKFEKIMRMKYGFNWKALWKKRYGFIWEKALIKYWNRRNQKYFNWNSKGIYLGDKKPWSTINYTRIQRPIVRNAFNRKNSRITLNSNRINKSRFHRSNYNNRKYKWKSRGKILEDGKWSTFNSIKPGTPEFSKVMNMKFGNRWRNMFQQKWGRNWDKKVSHFWKNRNYRKFLWNSKGRFLGNMDWNNYSNDNRNSRGSRIWRYQTNRRNFENNYRSNFRKKMVNEWPKRSSNDPRNNNNNIFIKNKKKDSKVKWGSKKWRSHMKRKFGWNYLKALSRKWGKNWKKRLKKYWKRRNNRTYSWNNRGRLVSNKSSWRNFHNVPFGSPKFMKIMKMKFGKNWERVFKRKWGKRWKLKVLKFWERRNNRKFIWNNRGRFIGNKSVWNTYHNIPFGGNRFMKIMKMKFGKKWKEILLKKFGPKNWIQNLKKYWENRNIKKFNWKSKGRFLRDSKWASFTSKGPVSWGSKKWLTHMRRKYGWNYRSKLRISWGRNWIKKLKMYWRRKNNRRYSWSNKGRLMANPDWSSFHKIPFGSPRFIKIMKMKYGPNWVKKFQRKYGIINWKRRLKNFWKKRNSRKYSWKNKGKFLRDKAPWSTYHKINIGSRRFIKIMEMRYGKNWKSIWKRKYGKNWIKQIKMYWKKRNEKYYRWNSKGRFIDNSQFSSFHNVKFGSRKFVKIMKMKLGPNWIKRLKTKWGAKVWVEKLRKIWRKRNKRKFTWNHNGKFLGNTNWKGLKRKYCWDPKGKKYLDAKWRSYPNTGNINDKSDNISDCVIVSKFKNKRIIIKYYRRNTGNKRMERFSVKK